MGRWCRCAALVLATHCFMLAVVSDDGVPGRADTHARGGWGGRDNARVRPQRRTLRLRGGFKAKWGEKYIAGLTTKRVSEREQCRVYIILVCQPRLHSPFARSHLLSLFPLLARPPFTFSERAVSDATKARNNKRVCQSPRTQTGLNV